MESNGRDALIEEIDKELRAIGARLKKVLSKTEALLKEYSDETEEVDGTSDTQHNNDAADKQGQP